MKEKHLMIALRRSFSFEVSKTIGRSPRLKCQKLSEDLLACIRAVRIVLAATYFPPKLFYALTSIGRHLASCVSLTREPQIRSDETVTRFYSEGWGVSRGAEWFCLCQATEETWVCQCVDSNTADFCP
ncbi:hypothetical protein RRG08_027546 [Elysia crispata]|uniref:Uncharacterized protein n=1 Tax=Elysia crispata TaxID=231223 RepID=A0AAE1EF62_9GAST|nr:hypothetical protein RRG08_027546 [Elysia crispata]